MWVASAEVADAGWGKTDLCRTDLPPAARVAEWDGTSSGGKFAIDDPSKVVGRQNPQAALAHAQRGSKRGRKRAYAPTGSAPGKRKPR
jgi:hypothetical protein